MSIFSPQFPSQPTPAGATVATTQFPTELAPFIKDVLEKAKAQQTDASYQAYTGPQLAQFNEREKAAMEAIAAQASGLAGTDIAQAAPYFTGAKTAVEGLGQQFTGDTAQQYMNPYQQAVVDQAKAKAVEDYESKIAPGIAAQAVASQPFGGSRQAIAEGMARQDLTDKLTEIQERGSADAFNQGRAAFEAQKGRELQQGQQFAQLGQTIPQQALRDLAIQQQIGEQERQQEQTGLDLAKAQFLEEREFPTRAMQEYSAVVRGFPFQPSTYTASTQYKAQPSVGQQLLQLGGAGLGAYTQFGGELPKLFGATGGGIAEIYQNQMGENAQMQGPPIDPVEYDGPSAPLTEEFVEGLIADPNITNQQFYDITGFQSKQQYLDTPKYGESSEEKAQPFIIPEQPGDRERGFGPDFQYLNEGGLPTVYNNQASNAQAILDLIDKEKEGQEVIEAGQDARNLMQPYLRNPAGGVYTSGQDTNNLVADANASKAGTFNVDLINQPMLKNNLTFKDTGNLAKDLSNFYSSVNVSMPTDLKTKIGELSGIDDLESKALAKFRDDKGALAKTRTDAITEYSKRSDPKELQRRQDEAVRRKQQGIGSAIVAGAAKELDPNKSFVQTLSEMLGGISAAAKPVQDDFEEFILKEEDRALDSKLGLINMETSLLNAEGNLEKGQAALEQINIDKRGKVVDSMLKSNQINSSVKTNIINGAINIAIANQTNATKLQQLEDARVIGQKTLELQTLTASDNFYINMAKNELGYKQLNSEITKMISDMNQDMGKEVNALSIKIPDMIGKSFGITIDQNTGMPTKGSKLSPQLLNAYARASTHANVQLRNNANHRTLNNTTNGVPIQLNDGIYSIADRYLKDAYTQVGIDIAPSLSEEGRDKATEFTNTAYNFDSKGSVANSTAAIPPGFKTEDNLIAVYNQLGPKMFNKADEQRMLPIVQSIYEKKGKTIPTKFPN